MILWRYISAITSGQARTPRKARPATRRPPVSTPYCTARRADGGGTALRHVSLKIAAIQRRAPAFRIDLRAVVNQQFRNFQRV